MVKCEEQMSLDLTVRSEATAMPGPFMYSISCVDQDQDAYSASRYAADGLYAPGRFDESEVQCPGFEMQSVEGVYAAPFLPGFIEHQQRVRLEREQMERRPLVFDEGPARDLYIRRQEDEKRRREHELPRRVEIPMN